MFGQPLEAMGGLWRLLGLPNVSAQYALLAQGVAAIRAEVERDGSTEPDHARGWTDAQWVAYLIDERAYGEAPQNNGKSLADFVELPQAGQAGLSAEQVLAIRLYSSPVYRTINATTARCGADCLAAARRRTRSPPPTVSHLVAALRQLRPLSGRDLPEYLWRGVRDYGIDEADAPFWERGGTEMAFMSTTRRRQQAEYYAAGRLRGKAPRALPHPRAERRTYVARCGADISAFSCSPGEEEFLCPPGVHLRPVERVSKETVTMTWLPPVGVDADGAPRFSTTKLKILEVKVEEFTSY